MRSAAGTAAAGVTGRRGEHQPAQMRPSATGSRSCPTQRLCVRADRRSARCGKPSPASRNAAAATAVSKSCLSTNADAVDPEKGRRRFAVIVDGAYNPSKSGQVVRLIWLTAGVQGPWRGGHAKARPARNAEPPVRSSTTRTAKISTCSCGVNELARARQGCATRWIPPAD